MVPWADSISACVAPVSAAKDETAVLSSAAPFVAMANIPPAIPPARPPRVALTAVPILPPNRCPAAVPPFSAEAGRSFSRVVLALSSSRTSCAWTSATVVTTM